MEEDPRMRQLRYRAWHRGLKEADLMVGGFFDRFNAGWNEEQIVWFERLMDEQDYDILGWALGTQEVPPEYRGEMMDAFRKLDFIEIGK